MKKRCLSLVLALMTALSLVVVPVGAVENWYDAYRDFVLNEKYINYSGVSYSEWELYVDLVLYEQLGNILYHSLYDIDGDHVPELIVCQPGYTIGGTVNNIFSNLKIIIQIEIK